MYFITTIDATGKDTRCVGYYADLDKAIKAVEYNTFDIYEEGLYPYAVIENIPEGIYHYDQNPIWFKFNTTTRNYEKSERPLIIEKYFVGFSIG